MIGEDSWPGHWWKTSRTRWRQYLLTYLMRQCLAKPSVLTSVRCVGVGMLVRFLFPSVDTDFMCDVQWYSFWCSIYCLFGSLYCPPTTWYVPRFFPFNADVHVNWALVSPLVDVGFCAQGFFSCLGFLNGWWVMESKLLYLYCSEISLLALDPTLFEILTNEVKAWIFKHLLYIISSCYGFLWA